MTCLVHVRIIAASSSITSMAGKNKRVAPEDPPGGDSHKKKAAFSSKKPEAQEPARALPVRSNRGGGGPAKRVEAFDKATDISKRRKATGIEIPLSEPLNPMAPPKGKKPGRKTKVRCVTPWRKKTVNEVQCRRQQQVLLTHQRLSLSF